MVGLAAYFLIANFIFSHVNSFLPTIKEGNPSKEIHFFGMQLLG